MSLMHIVIKDELWKTGTKRNVIIMLLLFHNVQHWLGRNEHLLSL